MHKIIIAVAIVSIGFLILSGANASKATKTIEAEKFVLVGQNGEERAALFSGPGGSSSLVFRHEGVPRLGITVLPDGVAMIDIRDRQSVGRFRMGVGEDGCPVLTLLDKDGQTTVLGLALKADGTPKVMVGHPNQDQLAIIGGVDGSIGLTIVNSVGKPRASLQSTHAGNVSLGLCNKEGKPLARGGVTAEGMPWCSFIGNKGKMDISIHNNKYPQIKITDTENNIIFDTNK